MPNKLKDTVALVAGATRGAGRGIAVQLGAAGATVYCTGRTTKTRPSEMKRTETIEETGVSSSDFAFMHCSSDALPASFRMPSRFKSVVQKG